MSIKDTIKDAVSSNALTPVVDHDLAPGHHQRIYRFPNGFGASVVQAPYTYGGSEGLYELAVIAAPDWHLTYDTPITDDVIGWLTSAAVNELLTQIWDLPTVGGSL